MKQHTVTKTKDSPPVEVSGQIQDDLLECLAWMTRHFGRARSPESIRAGLPYDEKGMGPKLFEEAAARLDLKAKLVKRDLKDIPKAALPCVLILNDRRAVILRHVGRKNLGIFDPRDDTAHKRTVAEIADAYTGYVLYVHPHAAYFDQETPAHNDISRHWFWGPFFENKTIFTEIVIAAFLTNLFALAGPLFIMNVYDRVIPNNAIETGWALALGVLAVYVFDFIIRTLKGYFIDLAGRRVDVAGTQRIYDQLLDIKLSARPPSSGAFANMLRDFDSIRDFMTSATVTGCVDLPFTLLFLGVIWLIGGPIALLLSVLLLIVIAVGLLLQIPLKQTIKKSIHSSEKKHGLLVESIHGLETIKATGADGRFRARYGHYVGENAAWGQKSRFISALGVNFTAFIQQSTTVFIILIGMYMVRDQDLSMGGLIACVILAGRAIAPIGQVANLMSKYHQARGSLKTLNNVMAKPVERPAGKNFLHRPELKGNVTFDNVSFAYPGTEREVLQGVSFKITAGEKVGLIGRIGSGKSTLARLILGLYDQTGGTILADDTDTRQIDPADLRRNTAYIAQDVVLFQGTIRDNITIGRPHASEEDILRAAKLAGVHEFISRHPMGYDALVGERGEGLSGGQRQAVALARAILLRPSLYVCDEPTNAMDVQAEEAFRTHITQETQNKTLILITHRQPLLSLVDRLILLDYGKVIMDGPRQDVIEALSTGKLEVRSS